VAVNVNGEWGRQSIMSDKAVVIRDGKQKEIVAKVRARHDRMIDHMAAAAAAASVK
jgi:acetyltransferase-like isoleucine patch superfamily enzyme